jgi:hypothetical protein
MVQKSLPYKPSLNSVDFDLRWAVPCLLKKFNLWIYVQRGELVMIAATFDGSK